MSRRVAIMLPVFLVCAAAAQESPPPARVMNVTQGPETVFADPVAILMPALSGATATGENGRLGSELVFWGYEQAGGRRVFFFACAPEPNVDCAARVPGICLNGTTVLDQGQANGTMVRRSCRSVATASPGDRRPGCDDRTETVPLTVGLVTCG